jgi:hypothetical protein
MVARRSLRRQPEYVAYQASKSAALVVQKNARTFNAQRAYVKKRDEARFKAQVRIYSSWLV